MGGAKQHTHTTVVASNYSDVSWGEVWSHEVGHLLGLNHTKPNGTDRPAEDLMYPYAEGGRKLQGEDIDAINATKVEQDLGLPTLTNDQQLRNYDMYRTVGEDTVMDSVYEFTDIQDVYFAFYILDDTRDLHITTYLGGLIPAATGLTYYVALDIDNNSTTGGDFQGWQGIDFLISVGLFLPSIVEGFLLSYPSLTPIAPLKAKVNTHSKFICTREPPEVPPEPILDSIVTTVPIEFLENITDNIGVGAFINSSDGIGFDWLDKMLLSTLPPERSTLTLDPALGSAGAIVTATGTGFTPDENVSVIFNQLNLSTAVVGFDGTFQTTFKVPELPADHYVVDAIDDFHKVGVRMFTVIDDTPPSIMLLSPQNNTSYSGAVPLTLEINESVSWIGYSLNNQPNVTITGNTSIAVGDGQHQIIVYANDTSGNMGSSETVYFLVDTAPPEIADVSQNPPKENVYPENGVTVNATVTDLLSRIKQAILNYTTNNGPWIAINMFNLEGNIYNATIPAFPAGANVTFVIIAVDNANNTSTTVQLGYEYKYQVIPEFPLPTVLIVFMMATLLLVIVVKKRTTSK